jgi:hypothetical protein
MEKANMATDRMRLPVRLRPWFARTPARRKALSGAEQGGDVEDVERHRFSCDVFDLEPGVHPRRPAERDSVTVGT